jgi:FAD:protein FMN transferase
MARGSTRRKTTLPARLRLRPIAAVWLAFTIVSGSAPSLHADLRADLPPATAAAPFGGRASAQVPESSAYSKHVSFQRFLQRFEFHEPHMGTDARVVLYAQEERAASAAARAAFDRVEALNRALSDYLPTSELMQLSARAGQGPIVVSDDLFRVLAASQDLAMRSDGAFDVTCGPLTRLWRRARHVSELPAAARVEEARALTGYRAMQLDERTHTVTLAKPGMSLDVGGIAKGFAAEEAVNVLVSRGVRRALVALGGDIAVADPPPDREGWLIDVAWIEGASLDRAGSVARLVSLRNAAISTAGDAEQWLSAAGMRYSHILDARTGWPMTIRSSTTVIARHGLEADGLDTTAAVLGPDRGVALVEATPGAAVFMVRMESDGRTTVRTSSRWPSAISRQRSADSGQRTANSREERW